MQQNSKEGRQGSSAQNKVVIPKGHCYMCDQFPDSVTERVGRQTRDVESERTTKSAKHLVGDFILWPLLYSGSSSIGF